MTTPAIAPDMNVPPQPSPFARVINVFVAPSKAFVGLERKASSWWLPFLLMVIVSYAYVGVIDKKVGWDKVSENQIKLNQKAVDRLEKLSPEQRQQQYDLSAKITKGTSYVSPLFALVMFLIVAGVLLATFNFGFGASIKFSTMFAVAVFVALPSLLKTLLAMVSLLAGADPDGFNIRNPIATNLAAFVDQNSHVLYTAASFIDIFNIWMCVLTGIAVASVSRIKRGTAIGVAFGWYAFVMLLFVSLTAIFG